MSVTPTDADYDNMHHALGRPKRANVDTYRNVYVCEKDGETARRFEALGWWDFGQHMNDGRDSVYHVNGAGKQALAEWMKGRTP